ncbi:MAG TPA: FAD-dependent oxidoreductase [bacterium]|nr:FAD-dependent oxidoreductase [bacterium]
MADHPRGHEVAVLGGGVLGCAIAYTLARRKLAPIVVDRAGPGGEFPPVDLSVWDHTEPAETGRLGLESAGHFPHLQDQIGPIGYLRTGGLTPADTSAEAEAGELLARTQASAGLPVRWLSGEEALQREPALAPTVCGATYSPHDGVVNPLLMTRRLSAAARHLGATFLYHAGHVAISAQARWVSLRGAREHVEARRVIVASGEWLAEIDRQLGIGLPTRIAGGYAVTTEALPPLVRHRLPGVRQQSRGEVILDHVGGEGVDCAAATRAMRGATSAAARLVPALRDVRILHAWPWRATMSPDTLPLLGKIEEGIFVAVPHAPGVTLVPLLAHAVVAITVDGRVPEGVQAWDPRRARPAAAVGGVLPRKDSPKGP